MPAPFPSSSLSASPSPCSSPRVSFSILCPVQAEGKRTTNLSNLYTYIYICMAYAASAGLRLSSVHVKQHISCSDLRQYTFIQTCLCVVRHFSQRLYGMYYYYYFIIIITIIKVHIPLRRAKLYRAPLGAYTAISLSGENCLETRRTVCIFSISFYGSRKCTS